VLRHELLASTSWEGTIGAPSISYTQTPTTYFDTSVLLNISLIVVEKDVLSISITIILRLAINISLDMARERHNDHKSHKCHDKHKSRKSHNHYNSSPTVASPHVKISKPHKSKHDKISDPSHVSSLAGFNFNEMQQLKGLLSRLQQLDQDEPGKPAKVSRAQEEVLVSKPKEKSKQKRMVSVRPILKKKHTPQKQRRSRTPEDPRMIAIRGKSMSHYVTIVC
jgi:hypothetical protein